MPAQKYVYFKSVISNEYPVSEFAAAFTRYGVVGSAVYHATLQRPSRYTAGSGSSLPFLMIRLAFIFKIILKLELFNIELIR